MPTPIGHALGGAIVAFAFGAGSGKSGSSGQSGASGHGQLERPDPLHPTSQTYQINQTDSAYLRYCAIAACLPDIDFFWGRHNMETHSLGFAALVGLVMFVWRRNGRLALACTLAVCSHVLFDWLGSDDFPPLGVMALWPLTSDFYFANAFIFDAISRRYWLPGFVQHNVIAVLREIAILAPITLGLWYWRHATETRNHGEAYVPEGREPNQN
jgi:hypothetical protein